MKGKKVDNPLLTYIGAIISQKKVPKSFGLSHIKKKKEINLKSFYLRESYIDAFADSLALETKLKVLNLSRNQLTTNRLIKILLKLPRGVKELNLSNNPLVGPEAWQVMAEEVIEQPRFKLERLILEGCKITDISLKPLAKAIEYNTMLKFLDLSHNLIKD